MPRSYFRTLPDLYERKVFGTETHPAYSPLALTCFVGALCFAEQQSPRGRFKSRRLLEVLLVGPKGKGAAIARQITFLITNGDLIELPDGSLYIEGWDELQEGNWQVAERMSRYRARTHAVTVPVTPDVTVPVTVDPSRVVSGGQLSGMAEGRAAVTPRQPSPAQKVKAWLRDHEISQPVGWESSKVNELARLFGPDAVIATFEEARALAAAVTCANFVHWAEQSLAPNRPPSRKGNGTNGSTPAGHEGNPTEVERAFSR